MLCGSPSVFTTYLIDITRPQGRQTKQSSWLSSPSRLLQNKNGHKRTTKHRSITESFNGSNKQQRINNNRTTALEWQQPKPLGDLNAF